MTGAEATVAVSEFSILSLVCLVMMAGCAFGMALGFPWHWIVAAAILFLLASGYPGTAVAVLGASITVAFYAPRVFRWLEALQFTPHSRKTETHHESRKQTGYRHQTFTPDGRSNKAFGFDDFIGQTSQYKPVPAACPGGPERVLGLSGNFTSKELDAARRKLAKKFHPDLHREAPPKTQRKMAEKMRMINAAYEALKSQTA